MSTVIEILKKNREQTIDDLASSVIEGVPRYALASPTEVRDSCSLLFDEFIKVLETGQTDQLTVRLKELAEKRAAQGFAAADFIRAMMMTYPAVRSVVRKQGPRGDAGFAQMFEEVEAALFRMIATATNIYSASLTKQVEQRVGDLEERYAEIAEKGRSLEQAKQEQKKRLHEAEELNARVIASLSSGVIVVEYPSGEVLMWSPRLVEITGIPESEALGQDMGEIARRLPGLPYQELLSTMQATNRLPLTKAHLMVNGVTQSVFIRAERLRQLDRRSITGTVVIIDDTTEREMLIDNFSRYVSKEVVQRLLSRGGRGPRLEGERRACSILFADIRGFTGISERMAPEALHELLNHYFRVMIEQVTANDGIIDKFIGDKIMAIFTGDEHQGALSAVRASLAILSEIEKLNGPRQTAGAEPISVGIGVNTGTVMMGTVGSEERMSFTVIGDAVNVADRLQSLAPAGQVYCGAHTRELVHDAFELEDLGLQLLKGRANPEVMYRLVGKK